MIDIHCHILPGVDDGARDMEESLKMLRKAEKAGISDIVLTPHYIKGTKYNASNEKKWKIYKELVAAAKKEGIKTRLFLGNEIFIDKRLPEMLAGYTKEKVDEDIYEVSTLNSGKYVLVEFPVQAEDKTVGQTLFKLASKGFVPVIAHPERYVYIQNNLEVVNDWIRAGAVLQGDYLALTGRYGKRAEKTLKALLMQEKIFCLASDLHRGGEEYKIETVKKRLQKICGSEKAVNRLLKSNPRKTLVV